MASAGRPRYEVQFARDALKAFDELPAKVRARVAPRIEALADEPRPHGVRKIAGCEDSYRIRIGDYRVVYEIHDARLVVLVIRVRHRRDAYRGDL